MNPVIKMIGQIVIGFGFLYGLQQANVISVEIAITIGLLAVLFMFSFGELKNELIPVKNALSEMQKYLGKKWKFVPLHEIKPAGYIQSFSPVNLTKLGSNLLDKSGAKKVIDENFTEWAKLLESEELKTAYDVQTCASRIIAEKENSEAMVPLKDFAYKNPNFNDVPLDFTDIQRVMVIYFRNLYLEKHPEITNDQK